MQLALAEKQYTHLICELPVSQNLAEQIAVDFPLLETTYLLPLDTPKTAELSEVMAEVVSDEVKKTLDYLSIPVYFKNRQGEFLACNSYFSHLFGMTPAQVIGKKANDVLHAHLLDEIARIDEEVFAEQKVCFYECKIQAQGGKERDMVFRKESVANGKVQIGMLFDVTEINEARALVEKERIMLRATADMSADLIFFKDFQSRFLGCNKQFEKFVGCPEQEILGKKDDQLFELGQALMCQAQDQKVMTDNQPYCGEEYLTYNNGERHFIEMKKAPLRDKHGQVQGLIGVGRDITEHHLAQKRLKIADAAFENANENLLVTDQMGIIVSANKACCDTCGFSKRELLGSHVSIFASSQRENIEAALQAHKSWNGNVSYRIKNGEIHYGWLEAYVVDHPEEGTVSRIYTFVDLNQSKSVEEKIQFLSKHDPLTGLFNRIALFNRLENAITRAIHNEMTMAVILVDINGFKAINDQYGHNAGDAVLKEVAKRLNSCVYAKDTVARFGDDQFVLIVDELANEEEAAIVAKRIVAQFACKFVIENFSEKLSATIGIAMSPDDGDDVDTLIDSAERAGTRGKPDKGTSYHFYTRKLTAHSRQQVKLEEQLQQALQLEQFELYYQPQYDLNKRQVVAVEAVPRWNHPQRGLLHPENFLSLAENNGLLAAIGLQMLRKAAMQAVIWANSAINFGRIAINLSQAQLFQINFVADLQTILLETKCSSQWLEFTVDERTFESLSPIIRENLLHISKMGFALTIDNFAEQRVVFQLIEQLKIEKLKLSKHLKVGEHASLVNSGIQEAMLALTRSLGIDLVADSLGDMAEQSDPPASERGGQNKAMKAAEATFYLRCNKRK